MPSYMILILVFITIAFIAGVVFLVVARKDHLSGKSGEDQVSRYLNSIKKEDEFVINNFLASRGKNKQNSIQIDHIFISHKGVIVIETKDYRGRIYGDKDQVKWTQVMNYGSVKNSFYNPIKQNETHCNYINKLIGQKYLVFNRVLFLKADVTYVDDKSGIVSSIYGFELWYKNLGDDIDMDYKSIKKIYDVLTKEMETNPITKEEHINNIKRKHGNE